MSCAGLHNRGLLASYILLFKLEMTFLFINGHNYHHTLYHFYEITENLSLDQLLAVDVHLIYIY